MHGKEVNARWGWIEEHVGEDKWAHADFDVNAILLSLSDISEEMLDKLVSNTNKLIEKGKCTAELRWFLTHLEAELKTR